MNPQVAGSNSRQLDHVGIGLFPEVTSPTWSISYQWNRSGVPIPGATNTTYTLQQEDAGEVVTCTVTATNAAGSTTVTSTATPSVQNPASNLADRTIGIYIPAEATPGVITALESTVGRHFDMIMGFFPWKNGTSSIPVLGTALLEQAGVRDYMMTIQPSSGPYGATAANCVQWANLIAGDYDTSIVNFAEWINTMIRRPLYIRFAHEMNGVGWYDWQVGGACGVSSPADYIAGFNHFAAVLKANSEHARLVWAPNQSPAENIADFYPGECDLMGFSAYNFGTNAADWISDTRLYTPPYEAVAACNPEKPIWICETGCGEPAVPWTWNGITYPADPGLSKATWLTTMLGNGASYPRIAALVWFNVQKERDWIMNSSPDSTAAFNGAFADSRGGSLSSQGGVCLTNGVTGLVTCKGSPVLTIPQNPARRGGAARRRGLAELHSPWFGMQ